MTRKARGSNAALVLQALKAADRPLSAYDLLDQLGPRGISSPVTIYRALERLVAEGRAHRLETLSAYIPGAAAGDALGEPTGFAICDGCGGVEPLLDADLPARLATEAAARRFTPHRVTVEVHGICDACSSGRRSGAPS